jgi:hypothetical protein
MTPETKDKLNPLAWWILIFGFACVFWYLIFA